MRLSLTAAVCLLLAAASPARAQYQEWQLPDGSKLGVYRLDLPGQSTYAWYRQFPDGRGYGRAGTLGPFSAPLTVEKRDREPAHAVDTYPNLALSPPPVYYYPAPVPVLPPYDYY